MILGRAEVVITRRITIYARRGHDTDIDKDINFVDQTLKCKKSWTSNRQPGHKPESTRYLVKNESEHFLNIEFLGTGSAGYLALTVTAMKIDNILQRMWRIRCQQFWQHLLEWRWLDEGNVSHRAWSPAMVVNEQNINVAAHCEPSNPLTATVAKVTTSCRHRTESVTGGSKREMATQCAGHREGGGGWSDLRGLLVAASRLPVRPCWQPRSSCQEF